MKYSKQLLEAMEVANKIDNWGDAAFCWKKAYVSSVFSAIAYQEIPRFELKKSKRAKIIPCDAYQALVSQWELDNQKVSIKNIDADLNVEVVIRNNVLVTISRLPNVVFVSFRGTTKSFADFKSDIDVRRSRFHFSIGGSAKLHRGFFDAVLDCYDEVVERVGAMRAPADIPVCLTGHSLGGAMAAIFYGKFEQHNNPLRYRRYPVIDPVVKSCYTFGMPRYEDIVAKSMFPQPFHIYNELDVVPLLPPKIMGFVDSANERCLNAIPNILLGRSKGDYLLQKAKNIVTVLSVSDHRMERYLERTKDMM